MRWMKRGLFIFFAGLIALLVGGLAMEYRYETAQTEKFYAARPMLRAMNDALPTQTRPNDRWHQDAIDILLERVPRGTPRSRAMQILETEGIACEPAPGRITGLVCGASSQTFHISNWHIELELDRDDKLLDGRVLALKAGK